MFEQPVDGSLTPSQLSYCRSAGVGIEIIGSSPAGRPLYGMRAGDSQLPQISVVAGAHPDEPLGPLAALRLLTSWQQREESRFLSLAVVPMLDVDGIAEQRDWLQPWAGVAEIERFLRHRRRRSLDKDREFGWPGSPWGGIAQSECVAAAAFFDRCGPARAHCSLHGMFLAAGGWFLLCDQALRDPLLWRECAQLTAALGCALHDMPRNGSKGFRRAGRGFCRIPNGAAMRRWACAEQGGIGGGLAARVGLSSMDAAQARARRQGARPPLCAVSEFPLFTWPMADRLTVSDLRWRLHEVSQGESRQDLHPLPTMAVADAMVAMVCALGRAALR